MHGKRGISWLNCIMCEKYSIDNWWTCKIVCGVCSKLGTIKQLCSWYWELENINYKQFGLCVGSNIFGNIFPGIACSEEE